MDSFTLFFKPPRGSILRLWRAPSLRGYSAGRSSVNPIPAFKAQGSRGGFAATLDDAILVSSAFPSRKTRIHSLSDFTLEFLCIARNNLTRIASYLRKAMTKLCIKILVKADSAIESAFPYGKVPRRGQIGHRRYERQLRKAERCAAYVWEAQDPDRE